MSDGKRSLWFRFWVDAVSESIVWAQRRLLYKSPESVADVRIRLWLAMRLSWFYHRALDLAGIGLQHSAIQNEEAK